MAKKTTINRNDQVETADGFRGTVVGIQEDTGNVLVRRRSVLRSFAPGQVKVTRKFKGVNLIVITFNDDDIVAIVKVRDGETNRQAFDRWIADNNEGDDSDYCYEGETLVD